jgi:hypothetical protein
MKSKLHRQFSYYMLTVNNRLKSIIGWSRLIFMGNLISDAQSVQNLQLIIGYNQLPLNI